MTPQDLPSSRGVPPQGQNAGPASTGFSLVELLATVAILAVLIALILPALERVRAAGHTARCASALRGHFAAMTQYTGDHNGEFLPFVVYRNPDDPADSNVIWQTVLLKGGYLPVAPGDYGQTILAPSAKCPANHNGYMPPVNRAPQSIFYDGTPNYIYNMAVGTLSKGPEHPDPDHPIRRMVEVNNPSAKILMLEGGLAKDWGSPFRCGYSFASNPVYFDPGSPNYRIADKIHNGKSHVLFCDGHIEARALEDIRPEMADIFK